MLSAWDAAPSPWVSLGRLGRLAWSGETGETAPDKKGILGGRSPGRMVSLGKFTRKGTFTKKNGEFIRFNEDRCTPSSISDGSGFSQFHLGFLFASASVEI